MSVTLVAIRENVGAVLDDLKVYTATGGSTSTAIVGALISAASNAPTNAHNAEHIYNRTTLLQRAVRQNGFAPSTGTITFDPTATAVANGHVIELSSLFPTAGALSAAGPAGAPSYNGLIIRGLSKLLVPHRILLTITTGFTYSLAAYPWLDREARLVRVLEPGVTGGRARSADYRNPRLVLNAQSPSLELDAPYDSDMVADGGQITLEVLRPATSWVLTSGTWAASTTGPVFDLEEVTADLNDATDVTVVEACRVLLKRQQGAPSGRWQELYEDALARVKGLRFLDRSRYIDEPVTTGVAT